MPDQAVGQPETQRFAPPAEQEQTQRFTPPAEQEQTQRFTPPAEQEQTQRFTPPAEQEQTQRFAPPAEQEQTQGLTQPATPPPSPAKRRPSPALLVAAGAIVTALIVGGFALGGTGGSKATPSPSAGAVSAAYSVQVTDVIRDCASHSHGQTKTSFQSENCVMATRFLATGKVSGRPTVYVVSKIQMASANAAATVKQVLDATGTGNLNDLLREGKTFVGAPSTMPDSGYASVQTGAIVVVAEAGFVRGPSSNTNPALRAAAAQVAALVTAQG
jgi:hypothetical protein